MVDEPLNGENCQADQGEERPELALTDFFGRISRRSSGAVTKLHGARRNSTLVIAEYVDGEELLPDQLSAAVHFYAVNACLRSLCINQERLIGTEGCCSAIRRDYTDCFCLWWRLNHDRLTDLDATLKAQSAWRLIPCRQVGN